MDAPRAQVEVRERISRVAEYLDIGTLPHGGHLLRAMRIRQSWSRAEAAGRLGVSERTLRRWEEGTIWPSVEQLHQLCFALHAEEEEMVALTCGRLRFAPDTALDTATLSPEMLENQLQVIQNRYVQGEKRLVELELLMLKRQAWQMTVRHASHRSLLAKTYYAHARYYMLSGKPTEEGEQATQALNILAEKEYGERFALYSAIMAARGAAYGRQQSSPRRGIELLRHWLPMTHWPDVAA
jgi:transcriptional regulator with XRE-family HTH domain